MSVAADGRGKGRGLRAGLWLLLGLYVFAAAAPLLCLDRPYVLFVPESAPAGGFGALPRGWSAPLFSALFDRNLFGSGVDLFFNGLLAAAPPFLVLLCWRRGRRRPALLGAAYLAAGVALACFAAHRGPARDYRGKVGRLVEQGHAVRAVFPPLPYAPGRTDVMASFEKPSAAHPLGTDQAGRDVFTRLLFGTRISLTIGIAAVSVSLLIGIAAGALAGYCRGLVDALVMRLVEVVSCFPTFLLVMALIALVRERSIFHVMLVIGLSSWPTVARLVRAEFLRQGELEYTQAARAMGVPAARVIWRHLLPNAMAPVLVTAVFGVAGAILVESGLAFLRLGDPAVASWGDVLRTGRESGELHLILAPGILIFVTVTLMNMVAEGLRDLLDPRLGKR